METSENSRTSFRGLDRFSPRPISDAVRSAMVTITQAAESTAPILLRGETGTGKTLLTEFLRTECARVAHSFVAINCPTLSEELLDNEFHSMVWTRKTFNNFPETNREQIGLAYGGTLFFDEIGEMPLVLQAKLVGFLDGRRHERIGSRDPSSPSFQDIRVIAATNRNIEEDVAGGRFRRDLLFRLNVIEVRIPPLRERPEDILPLAAHFVELFSIQAGRTPAPQLSKRATDLLCSYPWPGNVRELKNTIEHAVTLWPGEVIGPEALPERLTGLVRARPFVGGDYALQEIEQEHILRVVDRSPTLEKAAALLGIDYTTLWRKRKRYV